MDTNQTDNKFSIKTEINEDSELMNYMPMPNEDHIIDEHRRFPKNRKTKKIRRPIRKGYRMLRRICRFCSCKLLLTPQHKLFCAGCHQINIENKKSLNKKKILTRNKKKDRIKRSQQQKTKKEHVENISNCNGLETKLKWAVDKLIKIQNPDRINKMCTVIIKLTETIDILQAHERVSVKD
ncbi:unnamed protein product [Rotaria magnacalcarata]|uniref:Uncharacterized protein n=2 Tax=Rotaria magnacalcarata TaxID=392030 RepID=A0A816L716_9BILA|nr:unnamed protein product [Rotaria magnacalcarata]CAF1596844.1 unnamed protein product [Rotaria magnacalcarata]CAF1931518.1 unnamed protein product [Rotaria magnacalcarata]CAF2234195.1 unnamed protein product [Rotaria magnacalcarata]CAF3949900.1 unnamed protein product [Rotaria magnacalcarata]